MQSSADQLNQAWQIHQRGGISQAEQVYRSVLQKEPNNANAWCFWGIAMHDLRRYAEAVAAYENAIRIQPVFPIAFNNLGNSLRFLGRVDDADKCFETALAQAPGYFNAIRNRGTLHAWTGRIDLAFRYYYEAMQLNPQDAELHRNLGVIHLLQGNFEEGWREYRYRWLCKEAIAHPYTQPKWSGQPLEGKTILLYAEQGLGDTIHFVRFAQVVKNLGARTIVHTQPALLALLQCCNGIDVLLPSTLPVQMPFDYHCSLIDVADVLNINSETIPATIPYLHPSDRIVEYWRSALDRTLPKSKLRIGINWQGNPDHQADMFRSFPLSALKPLANLEGALLLSLQKGAGTEQRQQWQEKKLIYCLPDDVDQTSGAFMDTAAIIKSLDYVVTSDTALAHLAGALGVKTCLVLGFTPDWRWLLSREDCPWYPSLKLFRQNKIGDWGPVIHEVCQFLSSQMA
ncbi:MAG: tetratricopeptide repeat protein [Pirellula sp.]|jgi:Tfp pilus assembly protein PilF|nr:tetratricopeptide repeat protein [Pirellula sp.]